MPDRTMLFEDLVTETNLRSKIYELTEDKDAGLVCVEVTGRRGPDWFFARRWVNVKDTRRGLYRLVDECERWGFRFAVATGTPTTQPARPAAGRASMFVAKLSPDELQLYHDIFREETRLLADDYDWDHETVWKNGLPIEPDAHGRILETVDGVVWEWVRVHAEFTWRRYPIEELPVKEAA